MEIRKTTVEDVDTVMEIIEEAKESLKKANIDQWQNGYPNRRTILDDIVQSSSYVLIDDQEAIIATAAISFHGEETYNEIEGAWLNDDPYVVIHRIAIKAGLKGNGLSSILLDFASLEGQLRGVLNLRIDTHNDNLSMKKFLIKNKFTFCGIITLKDGAKRLAFQRDLRSNQ